MGITKNSAIPEKRIAVLKARQQNKMAQSAHAYVRGSTSHFYQWLKKNSAIIPVGPPVWICGDCHIGNIGPLAGADGDIEIEIRDLDQTVIGNPAHDLIRLALSLSSASRGSDLPGVTVVKMMEHMVDGYEHALTAPRTKVRMAGDLGPIAAVLRQSRRRRWQHLAEESIEDVRPEIPLGSRFWKLKPEELAAIHKLFEQEVVQNKITALKGRKDDAKVRVLDAAYWVKGCSSLGRLRFAVLVGIGAKRDRCYCLVDLKEATAPAAPYLKKSQSSDGERVVQGARALSPNLGERMLSLQLLGKDIVMRELMPQDLKFELESLTQEEALSAARYLAGVVGKAHGRQMTQKARGQWLKVLRQQHPKNLDAPSWLWRCVLSLIGEHEIAYLEHCRKYAAAG